MIIKYLILTLLIIAAVANDTATYKIKNSIHIAFIFSGIILSFYNSGGQGVIISILTVIMPILLLFPLFALRMLGAGDIKLFASIGAIMGLQFVINTIVYSFLLGGVEALVLMILRKNLHTRLKYMIDYFKSCFLSCSLLPYSDFHEKSDGSKFRFSYAIASGVIFQNLLLICRGG